MRPARTHLTLVVGPPGAGKLKLIEREMLPGDRVIDQRAISRDLCGQTYAPRMASLIERRRLMMLRSLATTPGRAWLTADDPATASRLLKELMPHSVIRLAPPLAECLAAIARDPLRPAAQKKIDSAAARAWFRAEAHRA